NRNSFRYSSLVSRRSGLELSLVGACPLFEGAGRLASQVLDGGQDDGVVEFSLHEEAEDRIDELGRRRSPELRAGFVVGQRLEAERPAQDRPEDLDLSGRELRLRTRQSIALGFVSLR